MGHLEGLLYHSPSLSLQAASIQRTAWKDIVKLGVLKKITSFSSPPTPLQSCFLADTCNSSHIPTATPSTNAVKQTRKMKLIKAEAQYLYFGFSREAKINSHSAQIFL